jgi:cyclophilin family peptidyl-prolyl cis-trans isomerase
MRRNFIKSITVLPLAIIFLGLLILIACSKNETSQSFDANDNDIQMSDQQQISNEPRNNQKEADDVLSNDGVILERIVNAISGGYSYEGELFMNINVTYGEFSQELPLNMKGDVSPNGNDFIGIVDMTGDGTSLINVRLFSDKIYMNYNDSIVWDEFPEGQRIITPPDLTKLVIDNLIAPEYVGTTIKNGQDAGYLRGAIDPSYLGEIVSILEGSNGNLSADIYFDPVNSYISSLILTGSVKAGPEVQSPTGEDVYIEVEVSLSASNFGKPVSVSIPQLPPKPDTDITFSQPPGRQIDETKDYSAKIFMFGGGQINIDLFEKKTPITVNNFVHLAESGFYEGVTFHRVIPGFMAQTGDPTGTGAGGPGYEFQNEFHLDARHDSQGTLSMANGGIKNGKATNGSQFFITYTETPFLDAFNEDNSAKDCLVAGTSCHSVFGKVIDGMEILEGITPRDPAMGGPADVIEKILIYKK